MDPKTDKFWQTAKPRIKPRKTVLKKLRYTDAGFYEQSKASKEDTSDTGYSGYCFNCWLYGHRAVDCRQKNVSSPSPNYDHLKAFIAKQKQKSLEESRDSKGIFPLVNKPTLGSRVCTDKKSEKRTTTRLPKVFTVKDLDRQLIHFAKTKYALQNTSNLRIVGALKPRAKPAKQSNDPHSALGRGGFSVAQADPGVARLREYEWQEVKSKKKVRSHFVERVEIPLSNPFDTLRLEKISPNISSYSPPHIRNGVLGRKGNFRDENHKRTKLTGSNPVHTPPSFSKTLSIGSGYAVAGEIIEDHSSEPHTHKDRYYSPPHRRLAGKHPVHKPNLTKEAGLIVRWKGVGASLLDITEALEAMLPCEECSTDNLPPPQIVEPPYKPNKAVEVIGNQVLVAEEPPFFMGNLTPHNIPAEINRHDPLVDNHVNLNSARIETQSEIKDRLQSPRSVAQTVPTSHPTQSPNCIEDNLTSSQNYDPSVATSQGYPSKDGKCTREVTADYIGETLTDELLDLFTNEICDEEELRYQKDVLIKEILLLRNSAEDNDASLVSQQEVEELVNKTPMKAHPYDLDMMIESYGQENIDAEDSLIDPGRGYGYEVPIEAPSSSPLLKDNAENSIENIDGIFGITNEDRELGIATNLEGLSSPKIDKIKKKRGRKSFIELRNIAGNADNQIKIFDILNSGKGKCLPKDQ
ncbi:hypothetical protein SUGI_0024510 [Cryptomeria japonica]|nr:hypothetical protein SUGI_0024510 [Cryptomeria japonica]